MPSRNRKKRSKQRAEYLQKQDDILSQQNKAKARARYKADPEKKKASVHDSYKADPEKKKASVRDSYKADPEKKKASVRDSYNADIESKQSAKRQRYQEASRRTVLLKGSDIKRTSRRTVLLKSSGIKRTSRRTAQSTLLKGRNTRTIQLPLRHLKGIGIGMTPLSDWLNVLPEEAVSQGSPNYHYHPKVCHGMLYCTSIKKL